MQFPILPDPFRVERLAPPTGRVRMVLDTDTFNEVDDQFALAHALLSPERMSVEAVYAAPFTSGQVRDPAEGMEQRYQEIINVFQRLGTPVDGRAFRGSTAYLQGPETPCISSAAEDLVMRAMGPAEGPLYVVAIGAITNVALALLMEPALVERIVLVWLGGQPLHWPTARDYNLQQDAHAARIILDSGVPLVLVPCSGVTSHLLTTVPEIERYVEPCGAIGHYLAAIVKSHSNSRSAWSKVIWDIAGTAYLVNSSWISTELVASPILTDQLTWSIDRSRHFIRVATWVKRDPIFGDVFAKLAEHGNSLPKARRD